MTIGIGGIRTQNLPFPFSRNTEYGYNFAVNENGIKSYSTTLKSGTFVIEAVNKSRGKTERRNVTFRDKPTNMITFESEFIIATPFKYVDQRGLPEF